jgi:hypothetical protein
LGALQQNTTGSSNTAIGTQALTSNTTASNNTAVGYRAAYSNTTGTLNTFVGVDAGYFVTTGSKNTILGSYSGNGGGLDIRTASNYIVLSDGDGNPRGIFDNSGNFLVGCAATPTAGTDGISVQTAGQPIIRIARSATTSQDHAQFMNGNGIVGSISTSGSLTSYNVSSDYRLKNNIAPMTGALAKVALLKPCTYKWNVDDSIGQGFIAHELQEVVAGCVTGEKDAVDDKGNPKYQGIDTSFLVATLTAAIQEQQAMIEDLKTRLAAAGI